jgi:tRNA/tmRNA/rRNA uracil-C5-methylase (TrmA/RlmC/RlmD family)
LAEENARFNQVENIDFMLSEVKPWVRERSKQEDGERWDTAIVDPPREGLTPKVVKYLTRLQPTRIAYVSCNPKALAEELRLMEGYRLVLLRGYDLFPQTPHVEVLAVLEKGEEAM